MVDLSKRRWFAPARQLDQSQVRLPWLARPQTFIDECTRCGKCVDACETHIIEKGDGGFPRVNFTVDECTFCYQCAQSCPEPIFLPQDQTPWIAAVDISNQCLANNQVECRSCQDACPEEAIHFALQIGRTASPQVNSQNCSGCGACVPVCPSNAMTVHYTQNIA
ncbi:ferredoxin-type protein NapF [Vibrio metoecus]|uniref:ferredoxin-type protein NapF n=1 Tax=Vibrio metoecus TaxID=1481663 RepID=UPI0006D7F38F|nr:ferredoxin-type protein NapF [Vibrio metoecus]KQA20238.1 ferredoxin [Vibrio metoecus]